MRVASDTPVRRILRDTAVVFLFLFCVGYVWLCGRMYLAYRNSTQMEQHNLEQAIALDPWNAEYRYKAGILSLFAQQDVRSGLKYLDAAVALNPYSGSYWLQLANARLAAGDTSGQREALQQAIRVEPTTPDVEWNVANYFLVTSDIDAALKNFRTVIANDPDRAVSALSLAWRATHDVDKMAAEALPPEHEAYLKFLNLLTAKNETDAAAHTWSKLIALHQSFPPASAVFYVDYLLAHAQVDAAQSAWRQLAAVDPSFTPYLPGHNLIVNPSFDEQPLNGGFDWRFRPRGGVTLAFDGSTFHAGTRSVSVAFSGPAVPDIGLSQLVAVTPDSTYVLTGYVRSDGLDTASGPRMSLRDPIHDHVYAITDDVLGYTPWRQQRAEFTTGSNTRILELQVVRVPPDPVISGRFWLDDLSLEKK
jgi:hypothetical protein